MLTDKQAREALPPQAGQRHARYADFGGLYLEVSGSGGSRTWYWKYRLQGKEKRLRIGQLPTMDVKAARVERDKAREQLDKGVDPGVVRLTEKVRNLAAADATFEAVARDYHATKKSGWSDTYQDRWITLMEQRVFPHLGPLPIGSIRSPDLLQVLKRVEKAGLLESAHTLRQWCGQTFRHGIAQGFCEHDIAHALRDALTPIDTEHYAAVTKPADLKVLLDAIDAAPGKASTRAMLQIAVMVGQRPFNVRSMEWAHLDLDEGMWVIPAASMKLIKRKKKKSENDHYVPLADQAITVLRELEPLTGGGRFVFPGAVDAKKPASEATMNAALKRGGIPADMHVPHGFRVTLLTMGQEQAGQSKAVLDAALAHGKDGPLGSIYDRAKFLKERRDALQAWADYLDVVRADDKVVQLKKRRA